MAKLVSRAKKNWGVFEIELTRNYINAIGKEYKKDTSRHCLYLFERKMFVLA